MHTPVKRPRRAALALALSAALVTPVGVGLATAAPGDDVTLTPLGTFSTGAFDEGASEIVAHDPATQRAFVVNAKAGTVDVLDISDPTTPTEVGSLDTPGANSVDVHDGLVVVAEQADDKTDAGSVSFFDAE
ncbi:alkaline phosphatase, partial [Janibacter sp. RAF20_2_2]